jgi:hypothetical protein
MRLYGYISYLPYVGCGTSICNSVIIQSSENCYLYQSLEPARHLPARAFLPAMLRNARQAGQWQAGRELRRGGRASNRANLGIGNQKTNCTCKVKLFNYKWTSPISQPIILCPARSIENMLVKKIFRQPLDEGRFLFLSPFEKKMKRQTGQTSQLRNQFVAVMAHAIFVTHAEADGKIEEIGDEILSWNKPLYTFESEYNETLIEMGARPVNMENITQWATSLNENINRQ